MNKLTYVAHGNDTRATVTINNSEVMNSEPRRKVCVEIAYQTDGGYTVSAYYYPDAVIFLAVDDANARHPNGRITSVHEYAT